MEIVEPLCQKCKYLINHPNDFGCSLGRNLGYAVNTRGNVKILVDECLVLQALVEELKID